jgi:hypothetical protein
MIDQEVSDGIQSAAAPGPHRRRDRLLLVRGRRRPRPRRQASSPVLLDAASRISEQLGAAFSP